MFAEFWRVLKPAGSLYVFCGWLLAANIELLMRERFDVLNHIIWAKPSGCWNGCRKENLRSYTDVWTYPPVQFYPGKHPCEKPAEMRHDVIAASRHPDDRVADFFMGSGATIKTAITLGRNVLGVEFEEERYRQMLSELIGRFV